MEADAQIPPELKILIMSFLPLGSLETVLLYEW